MPSNDLINFMATATRNMSDEYNRIQARATEDAGNAGDQGEENWAELLRNWLPPIFQIVTRGRILSYDGRTSPQVDVLVLQPEYPKHLLSTKVYLAGGVLAAFECKVTLKGHHIKEFIRNSIEIKYLVERQYGSPYRELQSPLLYGLLAHSHSWKAPGSTPIEHVTFKFKEAEKRYITHPIFYPDLMCISDLAAWSINKLSHIGPLQFPNAPEPFAAHYSPEGSILTSMVRNSNTVYGMKAEITAIGSTITNLLKKLSWEYPGLRTLSRYFTKAEIAGDGTGEALAQLWPITNYSVGYD